MLKQWGTYPGAQQHSPNDSIHRVQMMPLRDDGLEKARMGITSLDEVARVVK